MIVVRRAVLLLLAGLLAACGGSSTPAPPTSPSSAPTSATPTTSPPTKNFRPAYGPATDQVASLSWRGGDAWALVGRSCGDGHLRCAKVFHSNDAGETWRSVAAPDVGVYDADSDVETCSRPPACVAHIVFADDSNGYLFGRQLFVTHDGGGSWERLPGPEVEAIATDGTRFFRIAYDTGGCPGPCGSRLQVTPVGSDEWRTVAGPEFSGDGSELLVSGNNVYVVALGHIAGGVTSHALISASRDGGATWSSVKDPCGETRDSEVDTATAAASGDFFAVECVEKVGQRSWVMLSDDGASSFGQRERIEVSGGPIAVSGSGDLAVAAGGGGEVVYAIEVSDDGGQTWTRREQPEQPPAEDLFATEVLVPMQDVAVWVGYPYEIWQIDLRTGSKTVVPVP
jgi:photosystem II stability/assembly factor-like uncharacterized protein